MARVIVLPNRLDSAACEAVLPELRAACTEELVLDGSAVCHIGAIGVQMLLSARSSCEGAGCGLRLTGLGHSARSCLEDLGIAPERIGAEAPEPAP